MLDAKEYLKQIRIADKKIRAKQKELKNMILQARSVSAYSISEKVQISSRNDRIGDTVAKLDEYQRKIDKDIYELTELKIKIMNKIDRLKDADEIDILYKRYFEFMKWEDISKATNFSQRQVHNIHGSALENFKKVMTENEWINEEE